MELGLDGVPEKSSARAENSGKIPEVLECCTARVEDEKVFLCAQEFYPEAWEALLNVPLFWGAIMDLPSTQGGSPAQGEHAKNSPERFPAPRQVSKGSVPLFSAVAADLVPFIPQKPPREGRNLPSCQIIRLRSSQDEQFPKPQSREGPVPEPFSLLKARPGLVDNSVPGRFLLSKPWPNLAETSNDGGLLTPPEGSWLRQPKILAECPKVALFNYLLGQGESIAAIQSQEMAELREEFATIKEDLKALKDVFGKLSQTSATSVSLRQIPGATEYAQGGTVPFCRCQSHRGQNDIPEDVKILYRLQDHLITIWHKKRVYGSSWKVLQSNLDQLEEKLNAIRNCHLTKSTESKVRFAGWSTGHRCCSCQLERLRSEVSSLPRGVCLAEEKIVEKNSRATQGRDGFKRLQDGGHQYQLGFRWSWLPFYISLVQSPEYGWINPKDRQVPVLEGRDMSSPGSSSGSRILTELPILVCFGCRSMGERFSHLHFMYGTPPKASQHVQVTTPESTIKVAASKKFEP